MHLQLTTLTLKCLQRLLDNVATLVNELRTEMNPSTNAGQDISVDAVHLMALAEAPSAGASGALQEHRTRLSFAFLDAAAGFYYVGSAEDDVGRSTLGALLAQVGIPFSRPCRPDSPNLHCLHGYMPTHGSMTDGKSSNCFQSVRRGHFDILEWRIADD